MRTFAWLEGIKSRKKTIRIETKAETAEGTKGVFIVLQKIESGKQRKWKEMVKYELYRNKIKEQAKSRNSNKDRRRELNSSSKKTE